MDVTLFPFSEYWWAYLAFTAFVCLLLALDLGVFHRKAHEVSFREAATWSVVWVALALAFNYALYQYALWKFPLDARLAAIPGFDPAAAAKAVGLEFLTGYLVEKSLAVDNIFIFVLVFSYFAIPAIYQHRVLFYGIIGALFFRAIFIAMGSALMQYHVVILIFGAFLIFTGLKMMFAPEKGLEPEKNPLIRLFRKFVPVTGELHGQRFFVRLDGVRHATPLFIALLFLELTDVIFAVDSVPAIFAITSEPPARLHLEHLRHPGAARDVLYAGWHNGQILYAQIRSGTRANFRRSEDDLAQRLVRREVPHRPLARHHQRGDRRVGRTLVALSEKDAGAHTKIDDA